MPFDWEALVRSYVPRSTPQQIAAELFAAAQSNSPASSGEQIVFADWRAQFGARLGAFNAACRQITAEAEGLEGEAAFFLRKLVFMSLDREAMLDRACRQDRTTLGSAFAEFYCDVAAAARLEAETPALRRKAAELRLCAARKCSLSDYYSTFYLQT